MDFMKYPHIANASEKEFMESIRTCCTDSKWVVSEKIHGANFQIQCDRDGNISCGSRQRYIPEDEVFYSQADVVGRYKDNIRELFDYCRDMFPSIERVIAYGEIFGGSYPHDEVPKDKSAIKVQNGVWYTPSNDWKCFDIVVDTGTLRRFLDQRLFMYVCSRLDIPTVPIIDSGITLDEALAIPCEFESRVYLSYGLPKIDGNMAEGLVIKPMSECWLGYDRAIIKNKNPKFKEIVRKSKPKKTVVLDSEIQAVVDDMKCYVTDNRLDNVISHGTALSYKNIGPLVKEMIEDIVRDYDTDTSDKFSKLEPDDRHKVAKSINKSVVRLIKSRLEG